MLLKECLIWEVSLEVLEDSQEVLEDSLDKEELNKKDHKLMKLIEHNKTKFYDNIYIVYLFCQYKTKKFLYSIV
jgi:hypothetical protein